MCACVCACVCVCVCVCVCLCVYVSVHVCTCVQASEHPCIPPCCPREASLSFSSSLVAAPNCSPSEPSFAALPLHTSAAASAAAASTSDSAAPSPGGHSTACPASAGGNDRKGGTWQNRYACACECGSDGHARLYDPQQPSQCVRCTYWNF